MSTKYLLGGLFVLCALFVAIGPAYASGVHKCPDCIANATVETGIMPDSPYLSINKTNASTTIIEVGGQIRWNISFRNYGNRSAYNVEIIDRLPDGLRYTDGTQIVFGNDILRTQGKYDGFEVSNDGKRLIWRFGVLPAGAAGRIEFNTTAIGTMNCTDNNATINGTYNKDPDCRDFQQGNADQCFWYWIGSMGEPDASSRIGNQTTSYNKTIPGSCINVTPLTTITVTKVASTGSGGKGVYEVCEDMNYTITVTQTGRAALLVDVIDLFPTCHFVNLTPVNYSVIIPPAPIGGTNSNVSVVRGHFTGTESYYCTNTVIVNGTANISPFVRVNATATEKVTIKYPKLTIAKDILDSTGNKTKYRITVRNTGTGIARNVTLNDTMSFDPSNLGWRINGSTISFSDDCLDNSNISRKCDNNTCWGPDRNRNDSAKTYNQFNFTIKGLKTCVIEYWTFELPRGSPVYDSRGNKVTIDRAYDNCSKLLGIKDGVGESATSVVIAQPEHNLIRVNKSANTTIAQAGDIINYTVRVTNLGSIALKELLFESDILPRGFEYVDTRNCTSINGTFAGSPMLGDHGQVDDTAAGRLIPDETITCWYTVRVRCDALEGAHVNVVKLRGKATKSDNKVYGTDFAVVYVRKPKLMIEKWTDVGTIAPDGTITIHVRVKNIGSGDAREIIIDNTGFRGTNLTQYFNYSNVIFIGPNCTGQAFTGGGNTPTPPRVTLTSLAGSPDGMGGSCEYRYTATAHHDIPEPVKYTSRVTLSYNDTARCPLLNQTATASVFVTSDVTLSVIIEAIQIRDKTGGTTDPRTGGIASHAEPSDFVLYEIRVINTGNNSIHNVTLVAQIPDGWRLANATSCGRDNAENYWGSIGTAGQVTRNIGSLRGTNITYLCLHVTSDASCGPTTTKIFANATAPDRRYLEDSDKSRPVEVIKPHLMIEKWTTATRKRPNENVTYYVRVKNIGCGDINQNVIGTKGTAENIIVRDYLSAWLRHNPGIGFAHGCTVIHTNVSNIYHDAPGDGSRYVLGGGISDYRISNLEPGQECIFNYTAHIHINAPEGLYSNLVRVNYTDNNHTSYLNQTDDAYILVMWQTPMISVNKELWRLYDKRNVSYPDLNRPMIKGDTAEFRITINNSGSRDVTLRIIRDYVDTVSPGLRASNISCTGNIASTGTRSTDGRTATITNMIIMAYGNITCFVNFTADQHMVLGININYVDVLVESPDDGWLYWVKDSAAWHKGRPMMEFQKIAETETASTRRNVTYKVIVKNTGTAIADTYVLYDKLPDNFTYNDASPLTCYSTTPLYCSNINVAVDSSNLNQPKFTLRNIPAGCECYFRFKAFVPENVSDGIYKNTMWGHFNDTNNNTYDSPNQTSGDIYITRDIRLLVNKSVNKLFVQPGDYLNFTIDVRNDGNDTMHNVAITDIVPSGISIVSATPLPICTAGDSNIVCSVNRQAPGKGIQDGVNCSGRIARGTTCTISIEAYVNTTSIADANVPFEGEQCNKVIVAARITSADGRDVNLRETDLACFIVGKPRLTIEKWVEGTPTKVQGTNVTYHIRVRNTGTANATNITIRDSMAHTGEWKIREVTTYSCGGRTVFACGEEVGNKICTTTPPEHFVFEFFAIGNIYGGATLWERSISPGAECRFAYNLKVSDKVAQGLYANNATVSGLDYDNSTLQESSDVAYVYVVKAGPMLRKEMNRSVAESGDTIKITLYIDNYGTAPLKEVNITDILPTGWNLIAVGSPTPEYLRGTQTCGEVNENPNVICSGGDATTRIVTCTPFALCDSHGATITFTVRLNDSAADGANINRVGLRAIDTGGNSYTANTTSTIHVVNPVQDPTKRIQIVKSASKYEVEPGDNLTFTLYIMNPSGATLYDIRIFDVMSRGFSYINGTSRWNGAGISDPNVTGGGATIQTLNWTISNLTPYSVNILIYSARVGCNISTHNWNYANVSAYTGNRTIPMNDSTNISIAGGHSNVSITKYASNYRPAFFDYVDYTIVIRHNTTWAHVQGINITDRIPRGLRYVDGSLRIGNIKIYGTNNESNGSQIMDLYDCPSRAIYINSTLRAAHCRVVGTISGSSRSDVPGGNGTTIFLNLTGYVFLAPWSQIAIIYTVQVRPNVEKSPQNNVTMWYIDPAYPTGNDLSANAAILVPPSLGNENNAQPPRVAGIALGDNDVAIIKLTQGWNLIGLSVMPSNKDVDAVLSSIAGKYKGVYTYENGWVYKVKVNDKFVGSLKTMEPGKGYWIYVTESTTLTVPGRKIVSMDISLNRGWNLIGYPVQNSNSVSALNGVATDIFGFDNGRWAYASHVNGRWLGTLTALEKNKGYWVKVKNATTISL